MGNILDFQGTRKIHMVSSKNKFSRVITQCIIMLAQEILNDTKRFKSKRNEVKYLAERYKHTGNDILEMCDYNGKLAQIALKPHMVPLWKNLHITLKEFILAQE